MSHEYFRGNGLKDSSREALSFVCLELSCKLTLFPIAAAIKCVLFMMRFHHQTHVELRIFQGFCCANMRERHGALLFVVDLLPLTSKYLFNNSTCNTDISFHCCVTVICQIFILLFPHRIYLTFRCQKQSFRSKAIHTGIFLVKINIS